MKDSGFIPEPTQKQTGDPARLRGEAEPSGARYRKRPIEVEAWRYPGGWELPNDAPLWIVSAYRYPPSPQGTYHELRTGYIRPEMGFDDWVLRVGTLDGPRAAIEGDWIIKGVRGELYPCKPDIFAETYEPLVDAETLTAEEAEGDRSTSGGGGES